MTKNSYHFKKPSNFSPDPLTDVLRAGTRELLAIAVRAEVSEFLAGHVHFLDDKGHQRLLRHGFLPEREVLTGDRQGVSLGSSSARPWRKRGWLESLFQLDACPALFAQGRICGGIASVALPQKHLDRGLRRGTDFVGGP